MKFLNSIDGASKIITDSDNRFVTDVEKQKWDNIDNKADKSQVLTNVPVDAKFTDTIATKSSVGLSSVQNYGIATQTESEIGASNVKYMTPLGTKQAINKQLADGDFATKTELDTGLLGKVDNSQVLTDVPVEAKFTDTITIINNKTGTITKADIVALGIPAQDTTYGVATTSANGLMSWTDKTNLNSNTSARHSHTNKTTLDKITEVGGELKYNGETVVTKASFTWARLKGAMSWGELIGL